MINKFGIEIHRFDPKDSPLSQLLSAMNLCSVDVVFDIEANSGQFSSEIRAKGSQGKIISFEPLSKAYKKIKRKCEKR